MSDFTVSAVQTRDPDLMAEMMTNTLGAVEMSVIDPRHAYLSIRSAVGETLSTLDFGLSFRGKADLDGLERDEAEQVYSIVHMDREPGHGRLWDAHEDALDVLRPVLYPDWVGSEFDRCRSHVVSIARSSVRDYAHRLAGSDAFELRFTDFHPRTAQLAEQWFETRRYLMRTIELTAGDPQAHLIRESLTALVASSVLAMYPNTLTGFLDRHDARPLGATAAVRRAVTFIDENLQHPITLADIVASSRLSVRALQEGFRRYLDVTPMEYLRQARLDAARRDLTAADPEHESVAAIARRWGFTHLGRFAGRYQDAFGEPPSRTLRG